MKKKFKTKEIEECLWGHKTDNLELVEEGGWVHEGKDESSQMIFKEISTNKVFMYNISRSGSAFTEWIYSFEWESDEIECTEVKKIRVTKYEWKER